ncbi:GIY-YIG nuclease family protein [Rubrivirga sp. IMCC43871]|uniref:GIY-YIG nuclease family protein n=1 Tax=Rubrivirga sp. IMCC43871 TaxID=3391575 RepID=UPI00398FEE7D
MREPGTYWVYILTNRSGTLYVGVTNDLGRRLAEHASGDDSAAFSARYALDRLIHVEPYPTARDAIAREKRPKGWRQAKKVALVTAHNLGWRDLRDDQMPMPPAGR